MLGKLFKRPGAIRVEDVQAMSAAQDAQRLQEIVANTDVPAAARAAALEKLASPELALNWRTEEDVPELRAAADTVLRTSLQADPDAVLSLLDEAPALARFELLQELAPEHSAAWLSAQSDEICLQIAQQARRPQDRQRAAEFLTTEDSLQTLQREARGHDKSLYRLAKTRLQNLRALEAERAARDEALAQVRQGLEKLIQAPSDPLLEGKLSHLLKKLAEIEPAPEEHALVEPLAEQVRQRIQQRRSEEATSQTAEQESRKEQQEEQIEQTVQHTEVVEDRAVEEAQGQLTDLLRNTADELRAEVKEALHAGQLLPDDYATALEWLQEQEATVARVWQQAVGDSKLDASLKADFKAAERSLTALYTITRDWGKLQAAEEALQAEQADGIPELGKSVQKLSAGLNQLGLEPNELLASLVRHWEERQAQRNAAHEEDRRRVGTIRNLIRRGRGAVKGGHLRQARGIWRNISEQLEELGEVHAGLREEADAYHEELQKLADWQAFAVVPKMEELIDHMRQLTERQMHPQDKADAVQALQQEWRKLSRGSGGQHQTLWDEFHALAEAAYAPCKDYFAEQAHLQTLNAEKRRELIGQLHQYHETNDWHNPDWAEVEKVLRLAARDWRHFSPVRPKEHRETEKSYHAIIDRIRAQLHEEFDRNRVERERIIEEARALRDEENLRTATERLKALQQEWKQSGRTHRKDDQRLWQEFRAVCDELFGRRDEQSQAFKAELDQHLHAALQVIKRIEQAATQEDDAQLQQALSSLSDWETEFQACSPLPKARADETRERFRKAVQALRSARSRQRHSRERATWQALFDRAKCLAELEAAMTAGEFDEALCRQVKAIWEDGTALPAVATQVDQRLRETLQQFAAEKGPDSTQGAVEQHRRQVVLLEVLTEKESPEGDRALRMEVQVERLAEKMGQQTNRRDVEAALAAWLAMPVAMPEADYLELHERVQSACLEYFFKEDQ
ncbi:MAG: DUF349 domain-containing protein [Natronospirillum sp.]|uniref:DUF349 domain-containing protein n=1 Tax=Natronospirillum sp. TaxID=2812955 RepID=UPI0025CE196E|nr:DUF349 domain-containing protein [Natronospirillum sp.]MCH8552483.1 DUF349 domain-containing protein [Natronospirillum sp.]